MGEKTNFSHKRLCGNLILMFSKKREILIALGIVVLFFVLRVGGIDNLYHQDEYKWPIIVNPVLTEPGGIPHPPVGEFIYRELGRVVGYDNFRIIPLIFSFLNILLLFYLAKMVGDKRSALWSVFFFAISFYSVLASLMVDTDGAVMPFFLLISLIAYYKLRLNNFVWQKSSLGWLIVLGVALIFGFLTKASFAVGILAIGLDFAFERKVFADKKKLLKYLAYGLISVALLALLLFVAKFVFPYFRLDWTLKYWSHFVKFGGRGWLQTLIQFAKSIMYLSPLLLVPLLFLSKEMVAKYRPFVLFIVVGLFFYLVAFDFSSGALDRYFQFLILPLVVLVGAVFAQTSALTPLLRPDDSVGRVDKERGKKTEFSWSEVVIPIIFAIAIFSLQFFNHFVPPLYPKTEWLGRLALLKWNFLFPFTGGSGPTGFYISFIFIALIWICSIIFAVSALKIESTKRRALFCILVLGVLYNGVFAEEYLLGKINGNSNKLVRDAVSYIEEHEDVKNIVVYNDNGGWEVRKTGKYARRMYATPQFEAEYRKYLSEFTGHIMFVGIPKIDENSFYQKYFDSCEVIYEKIDKKIPSKIYECNQ